MAFNTNQTIVAEYYVAALGRLPDQSGFEFWTSKLDGGMTSDELLVQFLDRNVAEVAARYPDTQTNVELIESFYVNVFGRASDTSGSAFWTAKLDTMSETEVLAQMLTIAKDPANTVDAAYLAAQQALAEAALDDTVVVPGTPGDTYYLTEGQDIKTGTVDNDKFIARGNDSLNNADILDGGDGEDTLEVMLDNGETAVAPMTTNIEIIKIQGQNENQATGDNQVVGASDLDAGDMTGVKEYWSEDSRSDVVIEGIEQNSHETTIGWRKSDSGDVDYTALFYNPTDLGETKDGATLTLDLVNVQALTDGGGALDNNQYLGFKFTLDGTEYTIQSTEFANASTYNELVTEINALFAAQGLTTLSATAGVTSNVFNSDTSALVGTKTAIVIENSGAESFGFDANDAWITSPGAPAIDNVAAKMSNEGPDVGDTLTQVKVELDYVGHGSPSGDLLIGNMSDGTTHEGSDGIQQFNVSVDRDSSLASVSSTANGLESVIVKNVSENNAAGNGALAIASLVDVQTFNASAMLGEVDLTATLSDDVVGKYTNRKDTDGNAKADNISFNYSLGQSNDTLNLTLDKANLVDAGNITSEDFELTIEGNTGEDTITTMIGDGTGVNTDAWYINHTLNADLKINAGDDNDTVTTAGAGDFTVDLGKGNDTYYADNTGVQGTAANAALVAAANAAQTAATNAANDDTTAANAVATANASQVTADLTDAAALAIAATTAANDLTALTTAVNNYNTAVANYIFTDGTTPVETAMTTTYNALTAIDPASFPVIADGGDADATNTAEIFAADVTTQANITTVTTTVTNASTAAQTAATNAANDDTTAATDAAAALTAQTTADATDAVALQATADAAQALATASSSLVQFNNGKATYVFNNNAANDSDEITNLESTTIATTTGANLQLTVTFMGITTDVSVVANSMNVSADVTITDLDINNAIKDAINNDATLSKLLVAQDGPAGTLVVSSLIDGVQDTGDLSVSITNAALTTAQLAINTATPGTITNTAAATFIPEYGTTSMAEENNLDIVGADSTATSDNTVTGGIGHDVIVLGTDATSNDTIVFSGSFGNDTIVNFETDNGVTAASDMLDFTAYNVSAATSFANSNTAALLDGSVSIFTEASVDGIDTNSTVDASEIAAFFENAGTATTATNHIAITYDADNIGSVWDIQNATSGASDATATLVGTIHLAQDGTDTSTWAAFGAGDIA